MILPLIVFFQPCSESGVNRLAFNFFPSVDFIFALKPEESHGVLSGLRSYPVSQFIEYLILPYSGG